MSEVAVFVCKTTANRDDAISFLKKLGFANITVEETDKVTYDAQKFNNPASRTDIVPTKRFVVIGVMP
jgi:hypothetical protein